MKKKRLFHYNPHSPSLKLQLKTRIVFKMFLFIFYQSK